VAFAHLLRDTRAHRYGPSISPKPVSG
jgi:hypothetical protein